MKNYIRDLLKVSLPDRRRLWKTHEWAQQRLIQEYESLANLPSEKCNTENLARWDEGNFEKYITSNDCLQDWEQAQILLSRLHIPEMTGGVNPGDQRLIYHLVVYLQPNNVLEIGTHIGASTVHFAAALQDSVEGVPQRRLVSVDILDVNNEQEKHWQKFGSIKSPMSMVSEIGCGEFVKFEISDSIGFFDKNSESFDLIFLDGSHSSVSVYQEILRALSCLAEGGTILLHDYFPELKPLWTGTDVDDLLLKKQVIPGPFFAVRRFLREGNSFSVLPFGDLPWATKLGTNITSMAVLSRTQT